MPVSLGGGVLEVATKPCVDHDSGYGNQGHRGMCQRRKHRDAIAKQYPASRGEQCRCDDPHEASLHRDSTLAAAFSHAGCFEFR